MRRLLLLIFVVACGGSSGSGSSTASSPLPDLVVQPAAGQPSTIAAPGGKLQLFAYRMESGGYGTPTLQMIDANWSTSKPDVATVAPDGLVTAVASGTAVITASAGVSKGDVTVTVGGM